MFRRWFSLLRSLIFTLLGGLCGVILGAIFYDLFLPFWSVTAIGTAPAAAAEILFIDYHFLGAAKFNENVIYIQTRSGENYIGNGLDWQPMPPLPNGQTISEIWLKDNWDRTTFLVIADQGDVYQFSNQAWEFLAEHPERYGGFTPLQCAKEWYLPALHVADSAGVVFGHALANEYICYVLYENGNLGVWSRTQDVFNLIGFMGLAGLAGLVIGNLLIRRWVSTRDKA